MHNAAKIWFFDNTNGLWKNPYVTDSLVAMWDGVWNAGPGLHDPMITKWIDCIQGLEFTPYGTLGETVIFKDKCVTLTGGASYLRRGSLDIKPYIQGNGISANCTIELCNSPVNNIKDYMFATYIAIGTKIGTYGYGYRVYVGNSQAISYLYFQHYYAHLHTVSCMHIQDFLTRESWEEAA